MVGFQLALGAAGDLYVFILEMFHYCSNIFLGLISLIFCSKSVLEEIPLFFPLSFQFQESILCKDSTDLEKSSCIPPSPSHRV